MSDTAEVIDVKARNENAVETAVQNFLDTATFTSIDHVEKVYERRERVGVLILYSS